MGPPCGPALLYRLLQLVAFGGKLVRKAALQLLEEPAVVLHFFAPSLRVDIHELLVVLARHIQTLPVEIFVAWHAAYRRVLCGRFAFTAFDDPFQNAHVLTETGPHELS